MIDLRSDTVTVPDAELRKAARTATVGDDVYGEDPTVNELEATVADLVGMEAALFVPTGTMGNQIAARVHTDPGQEVLADRESHVVRYELGGLAQLAGLQVRMLDADPRGVPAPATVKASVVEEDLHRPGTGLLCLENTHNVRGGLAISPGSIDAAAEAAHERGVSVHLDGARLWNAAVAHDVAVTAFTSVVDSVMVSLSKGLGAPVGSVLAGRQEFIDRARRVRKLFGGGMRQAGIIAGPGLAALATVDALETDHENARVLAAGLDAIDGFAVDPPETNIVLASLDDDDGGDVEAVIDALADTDVLATGFDRAIRFCTHRDVSQSDIERALERIETAMVEL